MESQILYKSLTQPKCDLDKNMNKTIGKDSVTVNPENNESAQERTAAQPNTQTVVQTSGSGTAEVKYGHKSKLLEQLQSPLEITVGKKDYFKTQFSPQSGGGGSASYQESSKNTDGSVPKDGLNSGLTDELDNNRSEGTYAQSLVSVQDSSYVVSAQDIKSETFSLASPTPSVSSSRSMSTSPLPSPSNGLTSPNEVSSSKSSSDSYRKSHKRRRRGTAWTDAETEYLMEVWARQADIIKLKGGDESVTCAPVYRLISRSMADQGWEKTWEQCKTRIHTLKRAYKITKDEINEGCQTITYCRHFDKLEIISGDNPQISPGMLAATLEQRRKQRQKEGKSKKQPVRRKLTVGENPNLVKRANIGNNLVNFTGLTQFPGQNSVSSTQSAVGVQSTPNTNTIWYPPLPTQQQQFQLQQQQPQQPQFQLQQHQTAPTTLNQTQQSVQQSPQTSVLPLAPQYPNQVIPTSGNGGTQVLPYNSMVEVNNNKIDVKSENLNARNDEENSANQHDQPVAQWDILSSQQTGSQTVTASQTNTGNDLERMRLNLEMRKLEVERNKIEMEERQRREDRDHQYRMMQLLLFGLGQQNISQLLSGQGSDVTHAHGTVLSRALENGLVPGGSQKVNEKGLSFSEL